MAGATPTGVSTTTAAGPVTPKISWTRSDPSTIFRTHMGAVLGADGTIYLGGRREFRAINPDGTQKWVLPDVTNGAQRVDTYGHPAVANDNVVFVSTPRWVGAFDGATGAFLSSATMISGVEPGGGGAVVIGNDGRLWVAHGDETATPTLGGNDNTLFRLDPGMANPTGMTATSFFSRGRPVLTPDNTKVILPNSSNFSDDFFRGFMTGTAVSSITFTEFDSVPFRNSVTTGPTMSILGGDIAIVPINDPNALCPAITGSKNHLAAVNVKTGSLLWNKCDLEFSLQSGGLDRYFAAVSSDPIQVYVHSMRNERIYALGAGGVTLWTFDQNEFGAAVDDGSVGPMTLAGGATIYYTYCSGGSTTRLVALNASAGTLAWDTPISGNGCFKGQPVPGTGNKLYVLNGPELIAVENSTVDAIAVASSAANAFGNVGGWGYWYSTMTVTATSAGVPVSSGVVVEVNHIGNPSATGLTGTITPTATNFLLTDTNSQALFPVQYTFGSDVSASSLHGVASTVSFRSAGTAPQTFVLKETRIASIDVSTTPAQHSPGSFLFRTSTMTFTVRDGSGNPVPNAACVSRNNVGTPYPGSASMTALPNQPIYVTNGAGQLSVGFRDNLTALSPSNYSVYAVTHTVACLGMPTQQVVMKENRVASVSFSTGVPVMDGTQRVWTITATLRDASSNPVPDVLVALETVTAPVAPVITPNTGIATGGSGQATFTLREDMAQALPTAFDAWVSTLALRILSTPSAILNLKEERITAVSVATSPAVLQSGNRVVVATVTVLGAGGAPLTNVPVGLRLTNFDLVSGVVPQRLATKDGLTATNALGQATFTVTQDLLDDDFRTNYGFTQYGNFNASFTAHMPYFPSVTQGIYETRAATFTISVSSPVIQSDVRYATITVTVRDLASNPLSGIPVAVSSYTRAGLSAFEKLVMDPGVSGTSDFAAAATDASGVARFTLKLNTIQTAYDTFDDFLAKAVFTALSVGYSTQTFLVESNRVDNYAVDAPTYTSVGILFASTVTARNQYNHRLSSYTESSINLTPLFSGTDVQGTGTLGTAITGAFINGIFVVSSQTYNKVEIVDIKASRSSDGKSGRSGSIDVQGPTAFRVHVPTTATAGNPFPLTIEAINNAGQRVIGYSATLALSALQASNPAQAGAGILGTTNVNLPGNGIVTINNQTYTKAEEIVIRAVDSGSAILGTSTNTLNVRAGTPVSLTLGANPQSTIATVPSVLTSLVEDVFGNKVVGATITYSVPVGSGVVSLSFGTSGAASTQAVTGVLGTAQAFFVSTNTLSSQANIVRAQLGALITDTTVYNAVLITPSGGVIANLGDSRIRVDVPANSWGFNVRMSAQNISEFDASDLAMTTAAFAAAPNVFISTVAAQFSAVLDSNPNSSAGSSSNKVTVTLPFADDGSGNVQVGAFRGASILVPFSVLRVFKLNEATSLFEMVLDGTNLADISSRVVSAQVLDPNGIYAVGAPAFTPLGPSSSGTVTAVLAAGATAQVTVPFGAFASATNLQVGVPSAPSVPALPSGRGWRGTGLTISIQTTNGLQPSLPVTVTIGYRAADIVGLDENTLRLARYDDSTGWVILDSSVDTLQRKVTGETDHFSLFSIVSISPSAAVSSGIVFPNPFRPAAGHTTLKFGQLPSGAKIKVYSVSGRLLRELEADATGQVLTWDAKDKDGRSLPSGVYLALIESGRDKTTMKFAIQR